MRSDPRFAIRTAVKSRVSIRAPHSRAERQVRMACQTKPNQFQSALRTRVRSDFGSLTSTSPVKKFQSALRTRVRSDSAPQCQPCWPAEVSIRAPHSRAERRGREVHSTEPWPCFNPRSALACGATRNSRVDGPSRHEFQSALRTRVRSDPSAHHSSMRNSRVSIRAPHSRAERQIDGVASAASTKFQSALRTRVRSDE